MQLLEMFGLLVGIATNVNAVIGIAIIVEHRVPVLDSIKKDPF